MNDDIVINKQAIVERCLRRIDEEFRAEPGRLENHTIQDSVVLNLQRACEATIDTAMHVVAERKLGVPQDARGAFDLLRQAGVLEEALAARMKAMVGFRNIAVHDYQRLSTAILEAILTQRLGDFPRFFEKILAA
jgi:uncharacterized protein YutE (UPF0331/DUF86 family)